MLNNAHVGAIEQEHAAKLLNVIDGTNHRLMKRARNVRLFKGIQALLEYLH